MEFIILIVVIFIVLSIISLVQIKNANAESVKFQEDFTNEVGNKLKELDLKEIQHYYVSYNQVGYEYIGYSLDKVANISSRWREEAPDKCIRDVSIYDFKTSSMLANMIENKPRYLRYFCSQGLPTVFLFDDTNKKIIIIQYNLLFENTQIIHHLNYDDIVSCELHVGNRLITSASTKSVVGRSLVGGLIAGESGSIVGGATASQVTQEQVENIRIKLYLNDISCPFIELYFYDSKAFIPMGNSKRYMDLANQVYGVFTMIVENGKRQISKPDNKTDSMKILLDLKEEGKISEEEFMEMTKKLLG